MRYTTIIDIRELPLYRSDSVRLLYLHLCLAAGYHENNRDQVHISLRNMAYQTGLSLSAVRHAIGQLEKANLLRREKDGFTVAKFVLSETIPKRAKTKKEQREMDAALTRELEQQERDRQAAQSRNESMHPRLFRGLKALGITTEQMGAYNEEFKANYTIDQVDIYLDKLKERLK